MATCNICGSTRFGDMAPNPHSIFIRKGVQCRGCGSLERQRLLYELLQRSGRISVQTSVLHIAPEECLGRVLKARCGDGYLACDLDPRRYPSLPVEKIDLCRDLARLDGRTFDIVIHNHVIEHLACDYRHVLARLDAMVAPGGVHAFSIPFMDGGYREAAGVMDEPARLAAFGQTDHYRVFSPDDIASTVGRVLPIPEEYDATRLVPAARLADLRVPEEQWTGFNNNSIFWLTKPAHEARSEQPVASPAPPAPSVLFVSSNGIGRGHLTRQIAVAGRLKSRRPLFLTMSHVLDTVLQAGYPVQFLPHHHYTAEPLQEWHARLNQEINLMARHGAVDALVYDASVVFDGVIALLEKRTDLNSIWIRRAMWPAHHASYLYAGRYFRTIVEPTDFADEMDDGPTVAERGRVVRVPPILRIEPAARMAGKDARHALALPLDETIYMMDLRSSPNARIAALGGVLVERLLARGCLVVELRSHASPAHAASPRHRLIGLHDAFEYSLAWDAAIVRSGYNTFHENILGAVPSLFVPDESPDMDNQLARALWAENEGCAGVIRTDADDGAIEAALDRLTSAQWRAGAAEACRAVVTALGGWVNGAHDVARLIDAG